MKKYLKISINQSLISMQYRFNVITKFLIYLISFFITYFLWINIYKSSNTEIIGNYTKNQMIVYILIVSFMHYIYEFSSINRLGNLVYNGSLSFLLIKPINFVLEEFFYYIGNRIAILLSFIGIITIAKLFGYIQYYILTVILILLLFIMYFYLVYFISTFGFWIIETWPLIGLFNGIFYILSGSFFPLDLLPKWIFNILKYNPFGIVGYGLTKALQSSLTVKEIYLYIFYTIIWSISFRFLFILFLKKGFKTYEGMGA